MEPIYFRVRAKMGADYETRTYPLSALQHLGYNAKGYLHAVIGGYAWPVAPCRSEKVCRRVEYDLLSEITLAARQAAEDGICRILDLAYLAGEALTEYRLEEDEAREIARADALCEAAELDCETGYDGVRDYHADVECRGGGA